MFFGRKQEITDYLDILDTLRGLKMKYPTITEKQRKELRALRHLLAK